MCRLTTPAAEGRAHGGFLLRLVSCSYVAIALFYPHVALLCVCKPLSTLYQDRTWIKVYPSGFILT